MDHLLTDKEREELSKTFDERRELTRRAIEEFEESIRRMAEGLSKPATEHPSKGKISPVASVNLESHSMHVEINTKDKCDARVWAEDHPGREAPCGKPSILAIVDDQGYAQFFCLDHARTLLESLKTVVENSEITT